MNMRYSSYLKRTSLLTFLLTLALHSLAIETSPESNNQDCPSNAHYVSSLPYWNPDHTFPCMYAGTFNVSQSNSTNHNLFYWLFRNTSLSRPPLVIWMNGGPGATSLFGLFLENGPLEITRTGTASSDFILGQRIGSWGEVADILFLDQPVGTGFSYGDSYDDRLETAGNEFVSFLTQFMKMYDDYQNPRTVFIAGESYAGKYIPLFAKYVVDFNNSQDEVKINLKGVLIGDPFVSPVIQRTNTHLVAQSLGLIDTYNMDQVAALRMNCEEKASTDWFNSSTTCSDILNYIGSVSGGVLSYDARIFESEWKSVKSVMEDFILNSDKKQELYDSLHINQSTKNPIWSETNSEVANALNYQAMEDYINKYDDLINLGNINTLVYTGQFDQRDGPRTIEKWLRLSNQLSSSAVPVWDQPKQMYYVKDDQYGFTLGGYYRNDPDKKFTFLNVPQAGHMVPHNQLAITKQFLEDYINNLQLICHKDMKDQCNLAPIGCKYMDNCSGHGSCQANGRCKCESGYKGQLCDKKAEKLTNFYNKRLSVNGTTWIFFEFKDGVSFNQKFEFTISSTQAMDVYIKTGNDADPNDYNYDVAFMQQSYVYINSQHLPSTASGFTAAVRFTGIDFYINKFYQSTITVKFSTSSINSQLPAQSLIETATNSESMKKIDDKMAIIKIWVLIAFAIMVIIGYCYRWTRKQSQTINSQLRFLPNLKPILMAHDLRKQREEAQNYQRSYL